MAKSQLHFLGHVVDLLTVETVYNKDFNQFKGTPIRYNKGGLLKFVFDFEANFRFLERMKTVNYELYKRGYPIDDGKIVFYDANGDNLKDWYFKDAPVVYYQFKFDANGGGMRVEMIISPAIQDYGCKLHRSWHITPIKEEAYKSPVQAVEKKEQYFVEEIKIENLDEGSKNGGSNKKLGIIYGKEYRLKVSKYKNNKLPNDNKTVKWSYSYTNAEGVATIGNIKQTGGIITFKTDDLDFCGNNITFYAYIKNKENEASLEVFHHYRFRWFDREIIEQQIEERLKKPWKINQGRTSLCGMACLFYIFAKNDKQGYKKLVETLHRTGKSIHNGYTVEPSEDSKEEMYNTNPKTSKEHPWIPEVDWITMATTRSKESSFGYTGKKGQDASAINWPWLMTNLGKKLLGYKTVEMDYYKVNKSYVRDFFGSDEKVRILEEDINKDYQNGYEICMMIDADMMYNKPDYDITDFGEYHWITYEGNLEILNSKGKSETDYDEVTDINFDIVTWGDFKRDKGIDKKKLRLSKASFRNNYYGYLKLK
ncbi:type VI secretion system tube protein TssD [Tenacibaculum ovolyticum]|uniref:type VI secretion system tube protein TssD n=1 Tax=Tenacibaculum ovolyticum TaxID=104270 RepID=UPI00040CD73A|nr:type VI secretion system tube protein TssD [Tenacibaculum ovolyticum]